MSKKTYPTLSELIGKNTFKQKHILLVDDHESNFNNLKLLLERSPHILRGAAKTLQDAMEYVPFVAEEDKLWAAVLDFKFPTRIGERPLGSGHILASELCKVNPDVGIFSISEHWEKGWENLQFDPEHPHPYMKEYDMQGRGRTRMPDINEFDWGTNYLNLIELIGKWTPGLKEQQKLGELNYWLELHRSRGEKL